MRDCVVSADGIRISVFNKGNCFLLNNAVRVVEIGPEAFNISWVVDVFHNVWLVVGAVAGCEMVVALSLPDGQDSVIHIHIVVVLVRGHSGHEVPSSVLSRRKFHRVSGQKSCPEAISILSQIF